MIFRVALSILRLNESELLQADSMPALYVALESLPMRMWEVEKLLRVRVYFSSIVCVFFFLLAEFSLLFFFFSKRLNLERILLMLISSRREMHE